MLCSHDQQCFFELWSTKENDQHEERDGYVDWLWRWTWAMKERGMWGGVEREIYRLVGFVLIY
jgi:hypothetical protein